MDVAAKLHLSLVELVPMVVSLIFYFQQLQTFFQQILFLLC